MNNPSHRPKSADTSPWRFARHLQVKWPFLGLRFIIRRKRYLCASECAVSAATVGRKLCHKLDTAGGTFHEFCAGQFLRRWMWRGPHVHRTSSLLSLLLWNSSGWQLMWALGAVSYRCPMIRHLRPIRPPSEASATRAISNSNPAAGLNQSTIFFILQLDQLTWLSETFIERRSIQATQNKRLIYRQKKF